jgi:hypothetical protein
VGVLEDNVDPALGLGQVLTTEMAIVSGNQQDVLIVLIRQKQRAREDPRGSGVYIQKRGNEPQKPLQELDRNPGWYWTYPLVSTVTLSWAAGV